MAMRTYGLSGSGMDVDQLVKDLMKAKRTQYNSIYKQKTQLEWKKTDLNSIYKSLSDFKNVTFNNKLQSTLAPRKVASNSTAVTSTASAGAANISHSVEVSRLAGGVQQASSTTITTGSSKDTLAKQFGMQAGDFTVKITNGTTSAEINVDPTQSIYDLVSNINKAGVNVTASYDASVDRMYLSTLGTGAAAGLDFSGSSALGLDFLTNKLKLATTSTVSPEGLSSSTSVNATVKDMFAFNGSANLKITNGSSSAVVNITENDTLASLAAKLSGAAGVGATASFDAATMKFTVKAASGSLDLSTGSDAAAVDLFTNVGKLNIASVSSIGTTGVSSQAAISAPLSNVALASQYHGLAGKFDITVANTSGGSQSVTIDLATDTLNTIATKINSSGVGVEASYDSASGKFSVKSTTAGTVSLSGGNSLSDAFIADLGLSATTGIDATGVTSASALFTKPQEVALADLFHGVSGTFSLKLTNGSTVKSITIDTATDTLTTLKDKIQGAAGVNATASYDSVTRKFTIGASSGKLDFTGSDTAGLDFINKSLRINNTADITSTSSASSYSEMFSDAGDKAIYNQFNNLSGGVFTLKVKNGANPQESIVIDTSAATLDTVLAAFNAQIGPGTAAYDSATGKITLKAPAGGSLDFAGSDAAALDFFANKLNLKIVSQKGQDAALKLDGADITQTSNTFTIAGVTYTLNGTTEIGKPASIVVTPDIDKTIAAVKTFVDEYNKILSTINGELTEAKYKNYLPLSSDEKAAMKEDEIKAWEEKAKSGLLRRNPILSDLVTKMRNGFTDAISGVTGNYKTASSIGVDTSLGNYTEGGKLYFNENRLRTALNADPDVVYKIFGTDGSSASQDGIAVRLSDQLKSAIDKIVSEGGVTASTMYDVKSNIGKGVKDYEKRMERMNTQLAAMEKRYYKQFDAMETALNKLNQQNSWLSQQLGS